MSILRLVRVATYSVAEFTVILLIKLLFSPQQRINSISQLYVLL